MRAQNINNFVYTVFLRGQVSPEIEVLFVFSMLAGEEHNNFFYPQNVFFSIVPSVPLPLGYGPVPIMYRVLMLV